MNVFNSKAITFNKENFINNIIGLSYLERECMFVDRNVSKVTSSIDLLIIYGPGARGIRRNTS